MTTILVRRYTARPTFRPHYNGATGRYYGTLKEYLGDLKAKGLEPSTGNGNHRMPTLSHKPSKWSHEVAEAIQRQAKPDGTMRVADAVCEELKRRGIKPQPKGAPPCR